MGQKVNHMALESVLSRIGIQDGMLMQTSLITW